MKHKIPRWLELQAEIDYLYFVLERIHDRYGQLTPKSGIDKMIDEATGYGKKRLNDFEKEIKPICLKINKLKKEFYSLNPLSTN